MPTRAEAPRPSRKPSENVNAPGGTSNATRRLEVQRAADDHGQRRHQRADPQRDRQSPDRFDAPVEQRDVDDPHRHRDGDDRRPRHVRPEVARVLGKADVARGNLQRTRQDELPDEQERHQAPHLLASEALAQVLVGAARARHRRAEFTPDQAVRDDDDQRDEPSQQGLRPAKGGHQERDRDEWPDPDHVRHVQRGGLEQAELANQAVGLTRMRRRGCAAHRVARSISAVDRGSRIADREGW